MMLVARRRSPGSPGGARAVRASRSCRAVAAAVSSRFVSTSGRRRRQRRRPAFLEHPLAALHRRGAVRRRGDRQHAAVTEQPAPRFVGERDAPEPAAADVRDAVVPREPLVDERVVRLEQSRRCCGPRARSLSNSSSVSRCNDAAQVAVELGRRRAATSSSCAQQQPLAGEVVARARRRADRRACAAPALEHAGIAQARPALPARSSSSSGMLLHRKNDSRDASSRSLER